MPVELLQNAALLGITALGLIWSFSYEEDAERLGASIFIGSVYAVACFLVTASPVHLADGATIDARAGPVFVAGILGGPIAAVIAAIGGAAARYSVGGSFAFSGVIVYFLYAAGGSLIWRRLFQDFLGREFTFRRIGLAICLSLVASALMFFVIQPRDRAEVWLAEDYPWIALANTISIILTAAFGQAALSYARQRNDLEGALKTIELAKRAGNIGVWSYNAQSETVFWDDTNKALHGIDIEGNRGRLEDWAKAVHPEDLARVKSEFQDALKGRQDFKTQYRIIDSRGSQRTLKGDAIVERNASGEPRRVVGTNIDLTPLIEKEVELEKTRSIASQAQKLDLIGKLTGGVAHDFNNLLAILQGNLEILLDHEEKAELSPSERLDILTSAISATRRGAELTKSMLAFARRSNLEPESILINEVIQETERWIARTIPASIEIDTSLQHRPWALLVDLASLQSAIVNVIVNARDAMPNGGKLTIESANVRIDEDYAKALEEPARIGRYVMLAISDTGAGIDPDLLPNVFDPFVSSKDMSEGSGLGLSMVQGFVQQSGGFVRIYSEIGQGTSVKMFFPASEQGSPTQSPNSVADRASAFKTGLRILVAEDQIEVLGLVVRALKSAGHTVDAASSGDEAFSLFKSEGPYDLLVTDVVMPGALKGPDLARECRKIEANLPVIFMSGYASEATVHGNGLRPTDVRLMKPVPRSELLDAVTRSLAHNSSGSGVV